MEIYNLNIPYVETTRFDALGKSRKLLVITMLSSMGVFMDGYALSIFSSALIFLKNSFLSVAIFISLAAASIYIGMFLGSLIMGRLSDSIGRKRIYVYDLAISSFFLIMTGLSFNFATFFIFQLLAGIGIGADYPISSSIQAEFSPKKTRGKYLVFNIFSWTFGSVVFYVISIPIVLYTGVDAWRVMYVTSAAIPLLVILARRGMAESPYWLMSKGRVQEAMEVSNSMQKVGGMKVSPPEIYDGKTSFGELRKYLPLIFFTSTAWFCYDVASYGVWNYTPSIFIQSNSSYVSTMISTLTEEIPVVLGTVICLLSIDRFGRKNLESLGFGLAGISLLIFAFISLHSVLPFIMIFSAFAMMHFFHNVGPTNITYLYPVELFPTHIRATAMGVSTASSRVGAILGVFAFPLLVNGLSITYGLIFFAIFEFIGFLVTVTLAVETKGAPLDKFHGKTKDNKIIS